MDISSVPHAADAEHRMIYEPADALGFTAWTDCFDYQNGRLGLSFKEIRRVHDAAFVPPRLEMGEAIGAPVSYCSAECGSADTVSERVYMASDDGGEHWYETGQVPAGRRLVSERGLCRRAAGRAGRGPRQRRAHRLVRLYCRPGKHGRRQHLDGNGPSAGGLRRLSLAAAPPARRFASRACQLLRHAMGCRLRTCNAQHHASRRNVSQ